MNMNPFADLQLTPTIVIGLVIAAIGLVIVAILAKSMSGPRVLRVPDGMPADEFYRSWKAGKIGRRVSRGFLFVTLAGAGMMLGGCGVVIWGALR